MLSRTTTSLNCRIKKKFSLASIPKKKIRTTFCSQNRTDLSAYLPIAKSTSLFNHTYEKVIGGLGKVLIHYMEAGAPKENKVLHLNHSKQECLWCILLQNRTDFSAYLSSQIYISLQPHI